MSHYSKPMKMCLLILSNISASTFVCHFLTLCIFLFIYDPLRIPIHNIRVNVIKLCNKRFICYQFTAFCIYMGYISVELKQMSSWSRPPPQAEGWADDWPEPGCGSVCRPCTSCSRAWMGSVRSWFGISWLACRAVLQNPSA